MSSVKVFVKDGCSRCPGAKEVAGRLRNLGYEVQEFDMETAEGLAEGAFYGVMSTPTMLVVDESENTLSAWRGTPPAFEEVRGAL